MFVCLFKPNGDGFTSQELGLYQRRMDAKCRQTGLVTAGPGFAAIVPSMDPSPCSCVARGNGWVAVGSVRLDNASEAATWSSIRWSASHLHIAAAAVSSRGTRCIRELLGDFAFVMWSLSRRSVVAASDALGVKALSYHHTRAMTSFSSLASLIAPEDDYDLEFMADTLVGGDPRSTRTAWKNVTTLHGGSMLLIEGERLEISRYWTPEKFCPAREEGPPEYSSVFKQLLTSAVKSRMGANGGTWSELSGGLDSSSIVCIAEELYASGQTASRLAGTVSIVDELGEGDERHYSDIVVGRFGLKNEQVVNCWAWQDDGVVPPLTDHPTMVYPLFARDRRLSAILRNAGTEVLFSGMGSDHYLYGSTLFLADDAATGKLFRSLARLAEWTVAQKQSYWPAVGRQIICPLLPLRVLRWLKQSETRVPSWIRPAFAKEWEVQSRLPFERLMRTSYGCRFVSEIAQGLLDIRIWLLRYPFEDGFERRYPFLSRPLVEFGLLLPVLLRAHPVHPKWVLRQAMIGTLPEEIRLRQGKGGIDSRLLWSLWHERARIGELLRDPILADLGCLDPAPLRNAVEATWRGERPHFPTLLRALALETWLHVRAGRWTLRTAPTAPAVSSAVTGGQTAGFR
jgi:asparagine synthase (glutamine-hydrolysing)